MKKKKEEEPDFDRPFGSRHSFVWLSRAGCGRALFLLMSADDP